MAEPNSVTNEIQNHKKEFHVDKYKPNSEEKKVITKVIAVGEQFKPLHQKLGELFTPEVRHTIAALKLQTFKVTKGDEGQLVELSVNKALMWKDFVQTYFGVTARRINQLLDTEEVKAERAAVLEAKQPFTTETPAPVTHQEKDREQLGMVVNRLDSINKAVQQVVGDKPRWSQHEEYAEVINEAQKPSGLVSPEIAQIESAGMNPHFDRKDPYLYFSQFKSEPQTLGDELAAMLIEFGLDLYQIKDVLRYAEKDAKLQLGKSQAVAA
jgi:hypothetical protein